MSARSDPVRVRPVPRLRVIEPRARGPLARARELWEYRWLIGYFGRRYLEKRYSRTWLGLLWIPIRPLLDVGLRVLLFGGLLGVSSGHRPYFIFFVVGMSAWELFERTAYWATRSLELSRSILRQFFVPRLTALVGAVVPGGVDFLFYGALTAVAASYYRISRGAFYLDLTPDASWLGVLAGLLLLVLFALGIGLWTSVFVARARDIRFGFSYAMGFWFLVTPVIYPISAIPSQYRVIARANPVTGPVEMVKHGMLGTAGADTFSIAVSLMTIAAVLVSGLWFFGRSESAAVEQL